MLKYSPRMKKLLSSSPKRVHISSKQASRDALLKNGLT